MYSGIHVKISSVTPEDLKATPTSLQLKADMYRMYTMFGKTDL